MTIRVCRQCGASFSRWCSEVRGEGKFCSRLCQHAWRRAQPKRATPLSCRQLRSGEPIPAGEPRRYLRPNGYVLLRWKLAPMTYVEAYEHRVVAGMHKPHVHHINGVKADNRPENLMPVSTVEHASLHAKYDINEAASLYEAGWSLVALAAKFDVATAGILRSLKKRGVRMRTLSESHPLRAVNRARAAMFKEAK